MASVELLEACIPQHRFVSSETDVLSTREDHPFQGVSRVAYPGIVMAFSGIEVGNTDYRFTVQNKQDEEAVVANRERLLQALPLVGRYVLQKVQLGPDFEDLSDVPTEELEPVYVTDGLITNKPNVILGLNPADCAPMVIFGRNAEAVGLIHVGRQGTDAGIHIASLEHMIEKRGITREDIRIYFGPSIREKSYYYPEISAEQLADPQWKNFIDKRNGNYHIDTLGRAIKDLTEEGIDPSQVAISNIDVGADRRYFSHARSKRTNEPIGRNGFVVSLIS